MEQSCKRGLKHAKKTIQKQPYQDGDTLDGARLVFTTGQDLGIEIVEDVTDVDRGAIGNRNAVDFATLVRFFTTGEDLDDGIVGNVANVKSRAVL